MPIETTAFTAPAAAQSGTGVPPIRPAFPYPGGKTRLLKHILPAIPPHHTYVEPFCGAAAVFLAKPRSPNEVLNDANRELTTFLRYAQFHRETLLAELARYPGNPRDTFNVVRFNPGLTELQRAVHWYLLKVNSFGAKSESYGRDRRAYHGHNPDHHTALITALSERIQRVTVECQDWLAVAKFYDSPDTFFFLDPPYIECSKTSYDPFTPAQMAAVRAFLDTCQGTYLLTCDDSPACREIFAGLPYRPMQIRYTMSSLPGTPKLSHELLILHPSIALPADQFLPLSSHPKITPENPLQNQPSNPLQNSSARNVKKFPRHPLKTAA